MTTSVHFDAIPVIATEKSIKIFADFEGVTASRVKGSRKRCLQKLVSCIKDARRVFDNSDSTTSAGYSIELLDGRIVAVMYSRTDTDKVSIGRFEVYGCKAAFDIESFMDFSDWKAM